MDVTYSGISERRLDQSHGGALRPTTGPPAAACSPTATQTLLRRAGRTKGVKDSGAGFEGTEHAELETVKGLTKLKGLLL